MDAHAEYTTRFAKWSAIREAEVRRFRTIGNARLTLVILAGAIAWAAFASRMITGWWLAAPLLAFVALAVWHERVFQLQRHASRAMRFYERGLERLEDRWAGCGSTGERFQDPEHLYAADIDILGKASLFELLSTARTTSGETTLAAWLMMQVLPTAGAVRARQLAVMELRERLDLREDLAVIGADVRAAIPKDQQEQELAAWGMSPPVIFPPAAKLILYVVPVLSVAAACSWGFGITGGWLMLWAAVAALGVARWFARAVFQVFNNTAQPARELKILAHLLERIENESWTSPRLVQLAAQLKTCGTSPRRGFGTASRAIARLNMLLERRTWSMNLFFQVPARLLLWDEHHARLVEDWKRNWGPAVGQWTAVVGELEALCSLSAFSLEHPESVFPEFVEAACFHVDAVRHPLIPARKCVPNDVRLGGANQDGGAYQDGGTHQGGDVRMWIVSGSNMSGKSTLLRSVALNIVLAWSGAPVLAARMKLSQIAIGASIRVLDSLQDGRSLFYAEITRLRKILDLTKGPAPVLFLIDELLHGTNSHDRRIGGEAVLRGLIDRGAMGMVTTHDLALPGIADTLAPRAANVHFEDRLVAGVVEFDYRLHPGVVTRSNALELMRAVGLIPVVAVE